jgi:hypothetical protein
MSEFARPLIPQIRLVRASSKRRSSTLGHSRRDVRLPRPIPRGREPCGPSSKRRSWRTRRSRHDVRVCASANTEKPVRASILEAPFTEARAPARLMSSNARQGTRGSGRSGARSKCRIEDARDREQCTHEAIAGPAHTDGCADVIDGEPSRRATGVRSNHERLFGRAVGDDGRRDHVGDECGGVAVGTGDAVAVDVEGGRSPCVAEALGHGDDGDAVSEHLGGHEMT